MGFKVETIPWDSNFFGFPVINLSLIDNSFRSIESIVEKITFKLCYVNAFEPLDNKDLFSYGGSKVGFHKKLTYFSQYDNSQIIHVDSDYYRNNLSKLRELAYLSGAYSRFNLDPNINRHTFEALYNLWLENAENKLFDNLFFVYADQNKQPLGLMTARFDLSNQTATVGLFAVDENFHGRGIGRKLLNFLEGFCIENNISTIHIPTQLENHNSNAFYKKMGYSPIEVKYIYHYWK